MLRKKSEVNTGEQARADDAREAEEQASVPSDQAASTDRLDHPAAASEQTSAPGPDVVREGADDVAAETVLDDYIAVLKADLEEARARTEEAERRAVFALAEFQNYRRRRDEEQATLNKYAASDLIKALLPIIDNFERALKAAEQSSNFDALVAGVSGTLKQLAGFLEKAGVTPIESLGQEFDPNLHEAIGHADSDEYPANTVAEEIQKGYKMHDRVLRPAIVKVSQD